MSNQQVSKQEKTFFSQPFGLLNLFSTEFCERFSYYGMRAILVFYIYRTAAEGGLGLTKQDAMYVMTLFASSVYFLCAIGGWVADRITGAFKGVLFGGIVITIGHILLSLPFTGVPGCFAALGCIALGTGLLKPNVATMVGQLYEEGDTRRQAGFNIYVMGINIGAFLSPLVVGWVSENVNFHIAFLIPAAFMIIALIAFCTFSKGALAHEAMHAPHPIHSDERKKLVSIVVAILIALVAMISIMIAFDVFTMEMFSFIMPIVSLVVVIFMFASIFTDKSVNKVEKNHVVAYIAIFVIAVLFWAIEELQSSAFAILADSRTDGTVAGIGIPPSWYQSVNPCVIIILAPLLAVLWTKWKKQPSILVKMIFGLALTAVSFIIPGIGFDLVDNGSFVSPLLLVIPIMLFSTAELFVSPIGLSATSELAPKKYGSRLMAMWNFASAVALALNAFCSRFFDEDNPSAFFLGYALVAGIIVVILLVFLKPLKKLMGEIR